MINIFTDASCITPAGVAGWAAFIRYPYAPPDVLSGVELCGNINRMELLAAIKALATIPICEATTIWTDSQYVVRGSAQFKKKNANADLWKMFDELKRTRAVSVCWVRGHSGHPDNEFVNKLACRTARKALRGVK